MKLILFTLAVLIVGVFADSDEEKNMDGGGVYINVLGNSGKIRIGRSSTVSDSNAAVTITMDSMSELDSSGDEVGTSGSVKHSFNSFSSQDFTFSDVTTVTDNDIEWKQLSFEATLDIGAVVTIQLMVAQEAANITVLCGEYHDVDAGALRMRLNITDWSFCGDGSTCTKSNEDEIGLYLEFQMYIQGTDSAKEEDESDWDDAKEYDLGSATYYASTHVELDNVCDDIVSGYPSMYTQGSKDVYQLRFDKFSESVVYETLFKVSAGAGSVGFSVTLLVTLAMCVIINFF